MAAHLRLYPGSGESTTQQAQKPTVRVRLGDLLPLIAVARRNNYLWVQDFLEDEVKVTPDLYEVLRAFGGALRPSA